MAAIGKTKFFDDRGNTFIRVGEKLAGFLKVDGLSVFEDRLSGLFFYDPISIFTIVMQKHFQFLACASSVTGAHDMGNLAEQIFLSLRMRVDPVDTEQIRISEQSEQSGKDGFYQKGRAEIPVDRLQDQCVKKCRQAV